MLECCRGGHEQTELAHDPKDVITEIVRACRVTRHISVNNVVYDKPDLAAATYTVNALLHTIRPCAFYVGITAVPTWRFYEASTHGRSWSHMSFGWQMMSVLFAGHSNDCCWLERALIHRFGDCYGCWNKNRGGENSPGGPVCFVYICAANGLTCRLGEGCGFLRSTLTPLGSGWRVRGPFFPA